MVIKIREKMINFNDSYESINFIEEFPEWQSKNPSRKDLEIADQFSLFFQHYAVERTTFELQCDLSYQIFQLQQCVEGILEEMEAI